MLENDTRVSISITDARHPFTVVKVRRRVVDRLEGNAALAVIDRIPHKYMGRPYPVRESRVVYLVGLEQGWVRAVRVSPSAQGCSVRP